MGACAVKGILGANQYHELHLETYRQLLQFTKERDFTDIPWCIHNYQQNYILDCLQGAPLCMEWNYEKAFLVIAAICPRSLSTKCSRVSLPHCTPILSGY